MWRQSRPQTAHDHPSQRITKCISLKGVSFGIRKNFKYLPNVFLPSKKAMQAEVEFVHPYLLEKCRSFFENVLHLKTPNEYEHFVKSLEKRYAGTDFGGSFEEHVQDIHALVKYLRNSDYFGASLYSDAHGIAHPLYIACTNITPSVSNFSLPLQAVRTGVLGIIIFCVPFGYGLCVYYINSIYTHNCDHIITVYMGCQ